MCNLALSDSGIKPFSTVIQRFRLPISPHDQSRWHREGWAVCHGGSFRPKLLKEMRRVAWLAKCLQSAEIRVRRLSALAGGCVGRTDVHRASSIGDGFDLQRKCRDQFSKE